MEQSIKELRLQLRHDPHFVAFMQAYVFLIEEYDCSREDFNIAFEMELERFCHVNPTNDATAET